MCAYACCGNELFTSDDKFDSGTGWLAGGRPSFTQSIRDEKVEKQSDLSYGMHRAEAMWCSKCRAHLGYVFNYCPNSTGNKYSINSVALKLDNKR
jgi:peptide-methionine (R)-S-oxide reductase